MLRVEYFSLNFDRLHGYIETLSADTTYVFISILS